MPLAVMVAVNAPEPETGLQSRWYRQHRIPYAPDPPEPDETPVSCRSNEVKAQFHLVQGQAELHDQPKLSGTRTSIRDKQDEWTTCCSGSSCSVCPAPPERH